MTIELSKYEGPDQGTSGSIAHIGDTPSDHELKTILDHSATSRLHDDCRDIRSRHDSSEGKSGFKVGSGPDC